MKRPLAYITAPWSENEFENTENAAKYCRAVYDAGFSPVCPTLFLPLFLRDEIPQEHKDCIDMAREYSPDNRAWANAMSIPANPDAWGTDRNCYLAVNSHPGLVDLFLSQTRKAYAQERQKTSVRDKLKKPPETTSPKISAKSKAPER